MYVTVVLPFVPVTPTVAIDAAGSPNAIDDIGPIAAAHRRDQRLWSIHVEPSLDDERGGAGVQRLGREHVSVGVPSRHAEEECARRDLARDRTRHR